MTTKQVTHPGSVHRLLPDYLHANEETLISEWLERAQVENNRLSTEILIPHAEEAIQSILPRQQHRDLRRWSK